MRDRLIALLKQLSYRRMRVTLASGRESDFYVDGKQTTLNAEGAWLVGNLVLDALHPEVVGVGGLVIGADPIASATAAVSWSRGLLAIAVASTIVLALAVLWLVIVELTRYSVNVDHKDFRLRAYFEAGEINVTAADKRTATLPSAAPRKQQVVTSSHDALVVLAQFLADEIH